MDLDTPLTETGGNVAKLKTVDIKGKAYVEVNERLKYFRGEYSDYSLISSIESLTDDRIVIKATISNPEGREIASGIAYEKEGSNYINKTSFVENCETSAWGRCLANFGIGIDASVASAQEVSNAIHQQENPKKKAPKKAPKKQPAKQEPWMGHEWKDEKQRKLFIGIVATTVDPNDHAQFEQYLITTMNVMNEAAAVDNNKPIPADKSQMSAPYIKYVLDNMTALINDFQKE